MEKEIERILNSEKNKYLKTIAIIYLILGGIILFGSIIYAINEENISLFIIGFITFSIIFFSYIMCNIFYEIHQMNKYLVYSMLDKNMKKQKETQELINEQEKNNEMELNKLLRKLDK